MMPLPDRLRALPAAAGVETVQVTLVDCPGHASLIRTIIGGAHIIDLVVLVVDVTRGIQAQTVECVVIAEITTRRMIVVLNKVRACARVRVRACICVREGCPLSFPSCLSSA